MQPTLNLRIPDFSKVPTKDLIPARSPSPKPPLAKINKTLSISSPFNRILSTKSLKQLSFPSFLQPVPQSELHQTKKNTSHFSSDMATNTSSIQTDDSKTQKKPEAKSFREIHEKVFNKALDSSSILLQVGKLKLSREDLQSLHPDCLMDRKVIDACLRCFKHMNRKQFKLNEESERVLIIDTIYSESIFTSKPVAMTERNPLKYNKIIFPLYLGYWTLVALDNQSIKLTIFNVFDEETCQKIVQSIRGFIKQQLKFYEKKCLESSGWRNLDVENNRFEMVNEAASAGLMARIAYKIAVKANADVDIKTLPVFRFKLLVILFNHGIVKNL